MGKMNIADHRVGYDCRASLAYGGLGELYGKAQDQKLRTAP
jgi:hypothetical protein